jgi:hypothetical protein
LSSGPSLIFDKSALECLNPDEAMWLDQFFSCNITPVFFLEVLADLQKAGRPRRTPEQIVGNLAYKTPDLHSGPNAHHLTLLAAELNGHDQVDMRAYHPVLGHGVTVALGDETGVMFRQTPEEEAFMRWQYGQIREFERVAAKAWRSGLQGLNLQAIYDMFQPVAAVGGRPKTLAEVKAKAESIIENMLPDRLLKYGLRLMGYRPEVYAAVLARWTKSGQPPIREFLPYFTHVLSVDLFFYVGIAADLISRERPSHKIDMAYLYYLPFCMVFTSNDKLHDSIVSLFLTPDQMFVPGMTLKQELAKLDAHYSALPEEAKVQGVYHMASDPPDDQAFLVTRLWDKYYPYWRQIRDSRKKPSELKMTAEIREVRDRLKKAQPAPPPLVSTEQAAYVAMERRVRIRQGKWRRFPPEVKPDTGEDD